ncbi:hypothetical protein [Pseudogulbenkiania sp. NH8B]|nr:hypothetical protein [Pseudogulbenkiania sp. NH8B]
MAQQLERFEATLCAVIGAGHPHALSYPWRLFLAAIDELNRQRS